MRIHTINLENIHEIQDAVVVIDVLRAFTTAAYAFHAGVKSIQLVSTVDEALEIRKNQTNTLIMGEVGGIRPEGFDLGNSPTALIDQDLSGIHLVQRTGAGTQGTVRCVQANPLLAASFVCASATARYLKILQPEDITLVVSGSHTPDKGDEDRACADFLTALLKGENPPVQPFLERVIHSDSGKLFTGQPGMEFDRRDLENAIQVDRFQFAMIAKQAKNGLLLRAQHM